MDYFGGRPSVTGHRAISRTYRPRPAIAGAIPRHRRAPVRCRHRSPGSCKVPYRTLLDPQPGSLRHRCDRPAERRGQRSLSDRSRSHPPDSQGTLWDSYLPWTIITRKRGVTSCPSVPAYTDTLWDSCTRFWSLLYVVGTTIGHLGTANSGIWNRSGALNKRGTKLHDTNPKDPPSRAEAVGRADQVLNRDDEDRPIGASKDGGGDEAGGHPDATGAAGRCRATGGGAGGREDRGRRW